ncbi:Uncharacterized protein GBIM_00436 [Gryllus bimaculatus]|nr:Uncharacterized protein GBIM_00436 [Gryllus bimaculatus]
MITVKGKEYFNVTHFFMEGHSIGKIDFKFDNLFNGDKSLGSPTLQLINDNWQQVWEELLPVFVEVFGNLYTQLSKRVFDRIPFNEIFSD